MLQIVKVVFRFDFPTNFNFINIPGTILKTLATQNDYWTEIGEARELRQIIGRVKSPSTIWHEVNFQAENVNGTFEKADGTSWGSQELTRFVSNCSTLCAAVFEECKITNINRLGMRFFVFDDDESLASKQSLICRAICSDAMIASYEKRFGAFQDLALTLEGISPSKVSYRLAVGPGSPSDRERFLQHARADPKAIKAHHLALDADLFERNLDFRGLTLDKWAKTKWVMVADFLDFVKNRAMSGDGH